MWVQTGNKLAHMVNHGCKWAGKEGSSGGAIDRKMKMWVHERVVGAEARSHEARVGEGEGI